MENETPAVEPVQLLRFDGTYRNEYNEDDEKQYPLCVRVVRNRYGKIVVETARPDHFDAMGALMWTQQDDPAVQLLAFELVKART